MSSDLAICQRCVHRDIDADRYPCEYCSRIQMLKDHFTLRGEQSDLEGGD